MEKGGLHWWAFMNGHDRALLVNLFALAGTAIRQCCSLPESYLSNPRNFINSIVLQAGWGITITVCASLLGFTSFVLSPSWLRRGNLLPPRGLVVRMLLGSTIWYATTGVFNLYRNASGECSVRGPSDFRLCRSAGGTWSGFDASGHAFLLVFNCLVLAEEVQALVMCHTLRGLTKGRACENLVHSHATFDKLRIIFAVYFLLISFVQVFNTFVLMMTCLYFHTVLEIVVGLVAADSGWFLLYTVLYPTCDLSPGLDQVSPPLKQILDNLPNR